jgi:uncharacterized protein (TIGR02453 family)
MSDQYFTKQTFAFLSALAENNSREWFEEHKQEYEDFVRTPALDFIGDMSDEMPAISRHFLAQPKKVGGSLMRVYRDTRFSSDKTPYKTNIGIQFRHALGKDVHAPGFYVHIATDECFLAVGSWHPDADQLGKYRDLIAQKPEKWFAAKNDKTFTAQWEMWGDSLTRPPRGYAIDHPAIEDIKRKDFVAMTPLTLKQVTSKGLVELVEARFSETKPLMKFLCEAIEVPY